MTNSKGESFEIKNRAETRARTYLFDVYIAVQKTFGLAESIQKEAISEKSIVCTEISTVTHTAWTEDNSDMINTEGFNAIQIWFWNTLELIK